MTKTLARILVTSLAFICLLLAPVALTTGNAAAVDILNNGTSGSSTCDPSAPGSSCTACNNPNATSIPTVCADNNTGGSNPIIGKDGLLTTYINILSIVVGVLSVLLIIFGGFKYITSSGDPQSVSSAQKTVIYAIVGLAVAFIAQGLVVFVLSKVKG
jgi:hypothetical protein